MTMNNTTQEPTAPEVAPDHAGDGEAGYRNAEDALARELGWEEESSETTQNPVPETEEAAVDAATRDSDDLDNGREEDPETDEDEADDEADEADSDDSEDEDEDSEEEEESEDEEEEDDDETDENDPFGSIPKEHHEAVGKLLSKTKQKERAKSERRIAELEEKATAAERVPDLEAQLESVKAQKVVPAASADSPYADVMSTEDLGGIENRLWELKTQLIQSPETYKVPDKQAEGGERYATDEEVRRTQALVDMRLQRDLPRRREWLARHTEADGSLKGDLPEIDDPKSDLHRAVNKVLASVPGLKTTPGYRRTALMQVVGEKLMEAKGKEAWKFVNRLLDASGQEAGNKSQAAKGKKKAPPRKAPPAPPRSKSAPKRPVSKSPGRGGVDKDAVWAEIEG